MANLSNRKKEIFLKAIELSTPAEQALFLAQVCGDDASLRAQVEAMLQAHAAPGSFLEKPAAALPQTTDLPPRHSEEASAVDKPGTRVGPYKLLQQLGEGGMGVVFMAEQEQPIQRKVALKLIKPGMDSAQVLARFESERQALALMDHPNIAKVLDAGTTESGRPFFVMELVKGIPITTFCDQEHLTPSERLALFVPVCQAVQHAHQKGIIHRDLKPSNVLIALYDGKPVPKVIDFGVAKATSQKLTERTLFTAVGSMVGTLEYMAPEQAELNNLDIDTRADIYALGVVLYELLTGSPPFSAKELRSAGFSEMIRIIREVEPVRPSTKLSSSRELPAIAASRKLEPGSLTKQVQGDLDWIVMKCLEKERGRRYETASAVALDLERHLKDQPVEARPPSRFYLLRKFSRRNRRLLVSVAVFLVLLIAGTTVSIWQAVRASRAEQRARAAEQRMRTERDSLQAAFGFLNEVIVTPAIIGESNPRQTLDRASTLLNSRFNQLPFAEAQARLSLGAAYAWLGEHDQALRHYSRAHELSLREFGPDSRNTLVVQLFLAEGHRMLEDYESSAPLVNDGLERARRFLGENDTITHEYRQGVGSVLYHRGQLVEAEVMLLEAIAGFERVGGQESAKAFGPKDILASLYADQGRFREAELLWRQVLDHYRLTLQADREELAGVRSCLGEALVRQNRFTEAEPFLREALASEKKLEKKHPGKWKPETTQGLLGESLANQGQFGEAEQLLLTAETGLASASTEQKNKKDTAKTLRGIRERLVRLYEAWGRPKDAALWRTKLQELGEPAKK